MDNADNQKNIDRAAALEALNKISVAVHGPRGQKKREYDEAKEARRQARKAAVLEALTTGKPTSSKAVWNARYALTKAASAVKDGASADELRQCTQLLLVAPWAQLSEAVEQYATARHIDAAPLLEALCQVAPERPLTDLPRPPRPMRHPRRSPPPKRKHGAARAAQRRRRNHHGERNDPSGV